MGDQIVPRAEQFDKVKTFITSKKSMEAITMALPKHITPEKMARVAITSIVRTPLLLECDPVSIMDAVLQASTLGLLPDGVLGHGYILPFKDKSGRRIATFIPGYKGLLDLARRSGEVAWIQARIVYENDLFEYEFGMGNSLKHVPARAKGAEPGKFKAAYCIAKFKTGEFQFEVMYQDEINEIRKKSRAADSGPWSTDWEAMALKTVIRRLCKFLPLNPEHQAFVAKAEYAEAGVLGDYVDVPEDAVSPPAPMDPLDALAGQLEDENGEPIGAAPPVEDPPEVVEPPPEPPPDGGDDFGDQSPHDSDLPFGQQDSGRITKNEDANFAAAVANMRERMRKVQNEELVERFIARTAGSYGAEKVLEIRSRLDREKFWRDLVQMCEQWESLHGSVAKIKRD